MAEAAWTAIQKRLEDEDPDVNRVWLEAVNCSHLHPSVRGEVGLLKSDECLDVSASCPHLTVSEIQYYVCIFPRNWVTGAVSLHSWRKHPFPDLQLQVVSAVLRNLIDHNWLIQMAATRALRLNQPAESQEARASTVRCAWRLCPLRMTRTKGLQYCKHEL